MSSLLWERDREQVQEVKNIKQLKLTKRDVDICRFLLDMKFSSVEEIHQKFFKVTLLGNESRGLRAAWRRLQTLEKLGFIKALHHFKFLKRFYIPTLAAYKLVSENFPSEIIPYPTKSIDIRTFEHDLEVIRTRLHLENIKEANSWKSDRLLRSLPEFSSLIEKKNVPDGVYIDPQSKRVCFEYERATKAKERYRTKIKTYVNEIRRESSTRLFEKVFFLCENPHVAKILEEEAKIYGSLFKIQTIAEFSKEKGGVV